DEIHAKVGAVTIGTERSDRKQIAKMQDSLLNALGGDEGLIWISADIAMSGVMALTSQRILYGNGRHIEYVIPGDRVARSAIGVGPFYSGKHSKRHCLKVTWIGGPLKHQRIRN